MRHVYCINTVQFPRAASLYRLPDKFIAVVPMPKALISFVINFYLATILRYIIHRSALMHRALVALFAARDKITAYVYAYSHLLLLKISNL